MAQLLQHDIPAPLGFPAGEIDWNALPEQLTTRQVADLLGKSTGNVRARASKGDFGMTSPGPDGLPRYDRERVRPIYERMTARQAQSRSPQFPTELPALSDSSLPPAINVLLTAVQAQYAEQVALCKAWVEEAQATVWQTKKEAQELRALLREREETTRATLAHMDMLHDQNIRQAQEMLERERAHWAAEISARDAEIKRIKSEPPRKNLGMFRWGK